MQNTSEIIEIVEGTTKILVPAGAISEKVPPKEPAFFNPKAKLNRDFSLLAYSAFAKKFDGPKIFLEGLSGLGPRGLRVANELKCMESIILNDLNPSALELAKKSAELNNINNLKVSENEVCRFFSNYSKKGERGSFVDIDPFGSPAKYLDCCIRATMHGGLLSVTATDLQVLHGLFHNSCKRRYGGNPIKTEYSNEISLRLILGCMRAIAARMDIEIVPLFVESDMHYYRVYVKILNRPDQTENLGYIFHCFECGNRGHDVEKVDTCRICKSKMATAGPLWIGKIFEKSFVESMQKECSNITVDKKCDKILAKCVIESDLAPTYFTLDEIASKMKCSPLKLEEAIKRLTSNGFVASHTSLQHTGFRTNATIDKIKEIFSS